MKQFTITIQDKEGLHARPAGLLSKAAKGFQCAVTLTKGEKTADLKKIFAVMGLEMCIRDRDARACARYQGWRTCRWTYRCCRIRP